MHAAIEQFCRNGHLARSIFSYLVDVAGPIEKSKCIQLYVHSFIHSMQLCNKIRRFLPVMPIQLQNIPFDCLAARHPFNSYTECL